VSTLTISAIGLLNRFICKEVDNKAKKIIILINYNNSKIINTKSVLLNDLEYDCFGDFGAGYKITENLKITLPIGRDIKFH